MQLIPQRQQLTMKILNYEKVSDLLHTSGQPRQEEFQLIANLGVDTVINLAMPDSDNAIADEGFLVTSSGMNYFHIPVVWEQPGVDQFELFASLLTHHRQRKVWVHCALNWRVSSFIYLYRVHCLGGDPDEAYKALTQT